MWLFVICVSLDQKTKYMQNIIWKQKNQFERVVFGTRQQRKSQQRKKKRLHKRILPNIERINTSLCQILPKNWRRGSTSKLILWGQHYSDIKVRQRHHQERKRQTNILNEYTFKNLSKILASWVQQHIKRIILHHG